MDIYNMCLVLRRHKEKHGPRSIRYFLEPGEPIEIVFEPWNLEPSCLARIIFFPTLLQNFIFLRLSEKEGLQK